MYDEYSYIWESMVLGTIINAKKVIQIENKVTSYHKDKRSMFPINDFRRCFLVLQIRIIIYPFSCTSCVSHSF